MKAQSFGFTPAEAAILDLEQHSNDVGAACLHAYGGGLTPHATLRLIVYHIRAALDLDLADHARRQFAALVELARRYPALQSRAAAPGQAARKPTTRVAGVSTHTPRDQKRPLQDMLRPDPRRTVFRIDPDYRQQWRRPPAHHPVR